MFAGDKHPGVNLSVEDAQDLIKDAALRQGLHWEESALPPLESKKATSDVTPVSSEFTHTFGGPGTLWWEMAPA